MLCLTHKISDRFIGWAFVFEVRKEEATKIAWKVDPNTFSKFERTPNASRVVKWFMKKEVQ